MRAALIVVALALVAIATDAALTRRKRQALPVNTPTAVGASSGSSSGLSPNELEEIIDLLFGLDAASGVPPAAGGVRRKRQALPTDLPSLSPEDVTSLPLVEELEDAVTVVIGLVEGEQEFDESVFTTPA